MRWIVLAICVAQFVAVAMAKPTRPDKPKDVPIPKIAGPSVWGEITQDGRKIEISGHEKWDAKGRILPDGTLVVIWRLLEDGRLAPGQYRVSADGAIRGLWAFGDSEGVEEQKDGTFKGLSNNDTLRGAKD